MPVFVSSYIPLELICFLALGFCLHPFLLSVTHLIKYWWMWYLRFMPHNHNVFLSFIHIAMHHFCALWNIKIFMLLYFAQWRTENMLFRMKNILYAQCQAMYVCVAVFYRFQYTYNIFSLILGKWCAHCIWASNR